MEDVAIGLDSSRRVAWAKFYEMERERDYWRDRWHEADELMNDVATAASVMAMALAYERDKSGDSQVNLSTLFPADRGMRLMLRRLWRETRDFQTRSWRHHLRVKRMQTEEP